MCSTVNLHFLGRKVSQQQCMLRSSSHCRLQPRRWLWGDPQLQWRLLRPRRPPLTGVPQQQRHRKGGPRLRRSPPRGGPPASCFHPRQCLQPPRQPQAPLLFSPLTNIMPCHWDWSDLGALQSQLASCAVIFWATLSACLRDKSDTFCFVHNAMCAVLLCMNPFRPRKVAASRFKRCSRSAEAGGPPGGQQGEGSSGPATPSTPVNTLSKFNIND